jgi:hypothetical protein
MDLSDQLLKQFDLLETSCREYDNGTREAAVRLEHPLRILFHQTPDSASLLTQMGKTFIRLVSTAVKAPKQSAGGYWCGLIHWELDPQACIFMCKPKLDANWTAHRELLFSDWWASEVIYQAGHTRIRRKNLVLAAAYADGGSHGGATPPPDYPWLADGTGWKMTLRPPNAPAREIVVYEAHLAALRQIAHEVLKSRELSDLAKRHD